jgi:hypothetical protein
MSAGTIAGDRTRSLAGQAPTRRVPLRPPSGVAVSSSIAVPARSSCHWQASPALPPPGSTTPQHPKRAGPRRGPVTESGPRHLAEKQVNHVHSAPTSPGRRALAVILAIIGVLAIIAGILYVAGAANSLHFMVGSVQKGHHLVRAAVSFVVGVALLAGAWFVARAGSNSR